MNVYLIKRIEATDWDQYEGFVVVAGSERKARDYLTDPDKADEANVWIGRADRDTWMTAAYSSCSLIASDAPYTKPTIILASFRAG